jgi:hypothetical protein
VGSHSESTAEFAGDSSDIFEDRLKSASHEKKFFFVGRIIIEWQAICPSPCHPTRGSRVRFESLMRPTKVG